MLQKFELSQQQKASFIAIGSAIGATDNDRLEALTSFKNLVYVNFAVSYDLWEEGSLSWKVGYAQAKRIALFDSKGRLDGAVNTAWTRFASDLKELHGITKPQKTDNADSVKKAETRTKAQEEKEALMALSYENLAKQADDLRINGSKESMKQAVKILDIIDAKQKADEKAVKSEFSEKQKMIKDMVKHCNDHDILDSIADMLLEFQPVAVPPVSIDSVI